MQPRLSSFPSRLTSVSRFRRASRPRFASGQSGCWRRRSKSRRRRCPSRSPIPTWWPPLSWRSGACACGASCASCPGGGPGPSALCASRSSAIASAASSSGSATGFCCSSCRPAATPFCESRATGRPTATATNAPLPLLYSNLSFNVECVKCCFVLVI